MLSLTDAERNNAFNTRPKMFPGLLEEPSKYQILIHIVYLFKFNGPSNF